jgi:thimet oligopeptidase
MKACFRLRSALCFVALPCVLSAVAAAAPAYEIPEGSPVADALRKAEAAVAAIVAVPDGQRTFDNTVGALDDLFVHVHLDAEMIAFMAYVSTDAAQRERGQQAEEHVQNWAIDIGKRENLYQALKAYAATNPKLEGEQKRLLEHTLRDFRRSGMELTPEKRDELKKLELEETKLALEFEKNIRDDETRVPLTAAELPGVPADVVNRLPHSGDVYLAGIDAPTYTAIQNFCENETTREKMYIEYKRQGGRRNIELLQRMLVLRAQQAQLLGYPSKAAYETEIRMVKKPETVLKFYEELRPLIRKKSLVDFDEYKAAKRELTGDPNAEVHVWDQFYLEHWLMKHKYAVDAEQVQEYFPMQSVVQGLFNVAQTLYGIEIRDVTKAAAAQPGVLWHPDVQCYEIGDKAGNQMLGTFYLDPYPRDNKYQHFACFGLFPRKVWNDGTVQKPVIAMVCNFPPPSPDKPSLMMHEDVETLFHEFGHALHNLLTQVHYGSFSGTSTALDFVELPSQMFENWVWDPGVLKTFAKHYKTGEPLPDDLLKALLAAHNVASGIKAERQVFYGLVDLRYNSTPDGKVDTTKVGMDTMAECELFPPVPQTYFQAGFGHLTNYKAGYYGYLWSKVYAQDVYSYFREHGGPLNVETGKRWRDTVLARGGSVEEIDMLKDFLGREPRKEPFLEYLGLTSK